MLLQTSFERWEMVTGDLFIRMCHSVSLCRSGCAYLQGMNSSCLQGDFVINGKYYI